MTQLSELLSFNRFVFNKLKFIKYKARYADNSVTLVADVLSVTSLEPSVVESRSRN